MSRVSNSFSPQVNPYVSIVITGNANTANGVLTIGRVCVPSYKKLRFLFGGCATGYIGILWSFVGILLFAETLSLENTRFSLPVTGWR